MTSRGEISPLENLLARMLSCGTWISTATIAVGFTMVFTGRPSAATADIAAMRVVGAGIALLIMLPILRVTIMVAAFVRQRDYRFSAFAGAVLVIILLGFALGAEMAGAVDPDKNVAVQAPPDPSRASLSDCALRVTRP
jgi:uncharacterized membrane protein